MDNFFNKLHGNGIYDSNDRFAEDSDNENNELTTVLPGNLHLNQILNIESYKVRILSFLAEGGQAQVYIVEVAEVNQNQTDKVNVGTKLIVKRIAVPDLHGLQATTLEIEVLRKLKQSANVVTFYASSSQEITNGEGYETFILMEYCADGTLVEFMQSREGTKLHEPEILFIFHEICLGVAAMHYQEPPIIHRDLKVENILISSTKKFKLCDFGSCTTRHIAPNTSLSVQQVTALEDELMLCTTLQYRAPEMIDLYQRRGLTEKTDIWALGVLLYKLCFFTTPFEDAGSLAILNCRYEFPTNSFSHNLISLIKVMLQEDPLSRPDIYQIVKGVSKMRKVPCTIPEKSFVSNQVDTSLPVQPVTQKVEPIITTEALILPPVAPPQMDLGFETANITPMRRGRPTRNKDATNNKSKPLNSTLPNIAPIKKMEAKSFFTTSTDDPFEMLAQGMDSLTPFNSGNQSSFSQSDKQENDWSSFNSQFEPPRSVPRPPSREGIQLGSTYHMPRPPSMEGPPSSSTRQLPRPPSVEDLQTGSTKYIPRPPSREGQSNSFDFDDLIGLTSTKVDDRLNIKPASNIDPPPRVPKFDRMAPNKNGSSQFFNQPKAPSREVSPEPLVEFNQDFEDESELSFYSKMDDDDDDDDSYAGRSLLGKSFATTKISNNRQKRSSQQYSKPPPPPPKQLIDFGDNETYQSISSKPTIQREYNQFLDEPSVPSSLNSQTFVNKPPIPSRANRSRSTSLSSNLDPTTPGIVTATPITTTIPTTAINVTRPLPPPRSTSRPKPIFNGLPPTLPPKPASLGARFTPPIPSKPSHLKVTEGASEPPPKPPRRNGTNS